MPTQRTRTNTIRALITQLGDDHGWVREKARLSLVATGKPAIAPLINCLNAKNERVRWEAAKALGSIASPSASTALVKALEDKDFDVRWLAAEALITLGVKGVVPLLDALIERSNKFLLREGAHHVLKYVIRGRAGKLTDALEPVVTALESLAPRVEVPIAAEAALEKLNG